MKRRFTEEQIVKMIQEHRQGKSVCEISREQGIAQQTFYKWQKKYGDMKASEVRRLKSLEAENERRRRARLRPILRRGLLRKPGNWWRWQMARAPVS